MDILFKTRKLEKECNDSKLRVRRYGESRARYIKRRLDELYAAGTLAEIRNLPAPRCHELTGDLDGQLSVDLDGPYRLLFEPHHNPIPKKKDGGLDWNKVTTIRILGVEDTHD